MPTPNLAVDAPPDIPGFEHRVIDVATSDVGRLRVHLVEGGSGEPLLLQHGWPQHFWCWRVVAPRLAEHYRVICPDLRGFGWTDAPGRGYDPETFAADMLALLDALGIERVRLVGHDWGGFASVLLALHHPERVERLLALNTPVPWPQRDLRALREVYRAWYAALLATPGVAPVLLRRQDFLPRMLAGGTVQPAIDAQDAALYARRLARPEQAQATTALYRAYFQMAVESGMRGRYRDLRLTMPTRLVLSSGDPAVPPALARGAEEHADDLDVEVVDDCGHFTPEERPELVVERALALFA